MKIGKHYVGKRVEIQWADPSYGKVMIEGLLTGRAALSMWTEHGVVHDVTDGVVIVAHSYGTSFGELKPDEMERTAIPEALVERITVMVAEPQAPERSSYPETTRDA